ncbi:MAG: discoidin domain-containing protein [Planctomycetaceae bacterium]
MKFLRSLAAVCCLLSGARGIVAAENVIQADRPIHALLVTGGCCHDYDRQKLILTRGISARANVRWTVVHQGGTTTNTPIPLYDDPNWADGFDIVVHNECFSDVKDLEFVDRILKPHRDGLPAILIHCAMHCYRTGDDRWFEFVGMQSPGHGPHYSYTADNVKKDHPIMQDFGPAFVAPKGELYHSMKVFDTATPLAQANRQSDGMPQVCVWTNNYKGRALDADTSSRSESGKSLPLVAADKGTSSPTASAGTTGDREEGTRVFGCTMGHYNETMAEPKYLDMMARAVLWATRRDIEANFTPSTEKIDEEIKALITAPIADPTSSAASAKCCTEGNAAFQKSVTAKSTQSGNENKNLTDGRLDTRWCADGGQTNEWVTVDLGESVHVKNLRLHWERRQGSTYWYTIEASADGEQWKTIVDESKSDSKDGIRSHAVDAPNTRYLKTTFLGCSTNGWGSIWEFEAYSGDMPELPKSAKDGGPKPPASISDVQAPDGFDVRMFASPPDVNYPVCITAAATGEVFVGVDEQGSLGKETGRGKVLRCIDTDGDGTADQINEFAKMDHPRGLIYDNGSLWVLHPPFLSVYRDTNGDGTADESEVLIEGISTAEVNKRGADHTTNGIRMGIDGWIYIAVGDFGFNQAVAKDGTTLSKRGGGVVRIRPDGSDMEIFSWGQRNIVDIAIDPLMNVYTRDNTNDGGGWDIRLSHVMQTANYGYPSLYKNFSEEIMPPLADYGGGSGCGAMYFQDERWPAPFNDILLTCDWGRSEVFSHRLPVNGATFDAQQDTFLKLPRPTDIDADASGRMYVTSWKNGQFNYDGPNIGFVAMITPIDFVPHPVPDAGSLNDADLVQLLNHPSDAMRLHVQREILRRDAQRDDSSGRELRTAVSEMMSNHDLPLPVRVAAVWTRRQMTSGSFLQAISHQYEDEALREHCLRALADRRTDADSVPLKRFIDGLADAAHPRVQAAAIVGLGRLLADRTPKTPTEDKRTAVAQHLMALTDVPEVGASPDISADDWRNAHPERVLPHLAVKALVDIDAVDACIDALTGPHRSGALWALKSMHSKDAVDGLFRVLSTSRDETLRREIWTTLIRLYHREGEFTEDSPKWWGTRPDTTGPYYDRQKWSESDRIGDAIKIALSEGDDSLAAHINEQLKRHVVNLDGISAADIAAMQEPQKAIELPKVDPNDPNQIANIDIASVIAKVMPLSGNPDAGKELFKAQSCINCHTFANGQQPKGPHLVDIGKRYKKEELLESILDPSKKIAQGFDTWTFVMADGKVHTGFVVLESAETVSVRGTDGLSKELPQQDIDERVKQDISMMPKGIVGNLTVEQLADLIAYLQSLH